MKMAWCSYINLPAKTYACILDFQENVDLLPWTGACGDVAVGDYAGGFLLAGGDVAGAVGDVAGAVGDVAGAAVCDVAGGDVDVAGDDIAAVVSDIDFAAVRDVCM